MSYCRWSSDDYQSDVYCYEAETGFVIHVANVRYVFDGPLPAPVSHERDGFDRWFTRQQAVTSMVDRAERVELSLPHDGESFSFDTPGECANELNRLRAWGYNVPQYAIDTLHEEQAEQSIP